MFIAIFIIPNSILTCHVCFITVVEICFTETSQSVDEGALVTYTLVSSVPSSNDLIFTIHSIDATATG